MSSILIRRANMVSGGNSPRLPSEFTELAYLQSSGTQYINTGIVADNTTGFYIDAQKTTNNHSDSAVFGSRNGTNGRCWVDVDHSSASGNLLFGWNTYTSTGRITVDLARFTAKFNYMNDRKGVVNGVEYSAYTSQLNSILTNQAVSLYLFGVNNSGSFSLGFIGKIYSLNISKESAVVGEYVPAMRKADSVVGMYDLVSNIFLTNAGTGTFSYGTL